MNFSQDRGDHAIPGYWVLRFPNSRLLNPAIADKVSGTWPRVKRALRALSRSYKISRIKVYIHFEYYPRTVFDCCACVCPVCRATYIHAAPIGCSLNVAEKERVRWKLYRSFCSSLPSFPYDVLISKPFISRTCTVT